MVCYWEPPGTSLEEWLPRKGDVSKPCIFGEQFGINFIGMWVTLVGSKLILPLYWWLISWIFTILQYTVFVEWRFCQVLAKIFFEVKLGKQRMYKLDIASLLMRKRKHPTVNAICCGSYNRAQLLFVVGHIT